jgi:hypothetical protein
MASYIQNELKRHDYQCDTWSMSMEIPNGVLFRQYGLWWHLRSLLPYDLMIAIRSLQLTQLSNCYDIVTMLEAKKLS